MPTAPQLRKLAIIRAKRMPHREEWFNWVEREIGRRVASNRELTAAEASHLLTVVEVMET